MLAYHGNPDLKFFILNSLAGHREADKIVHGTYWENGRGCAVGCSLEAFRAFSGAEAIDHDRHALYETHLGIPQVLARLEDWLFEGLPNGAAQHWPERFASAIEPGADLSMIWSRFALWLLTVELAPHAEKHPKQKAVLEDVATLYREWVETSKNPARARWVKARAAADAAYADATYADAADAAAADAAAYAADAAAYAAYADAAADAAAAADAVYAAAYAVYAADAYAYAYADAAAAADAVYAAAYTVYAADAYAYADAAGSAKRISCCERMADKLEELLKTA